MKKKDKDQHAAKLLRMLSLTKLCTRCPYSTFPIDYSTKAKACLICQAFIGLNAAKLPIRGRCPCCALGGSAAIKRTWIALEEGGYLK